MTIVRCSIAYRCRVECGETVVKSILDVRAFEDFQTRGREGMEVAMESFTAWADGWQAIAAECADFTRASLELSANAAEGVLASRSIDTAYQTQAEYAKKAHDIFVGETSKLGELYLATAREVLAPIKQQMRKPV